MWRVPARHLGASYQGRKQLASWTIASARRSLGLLPQAHPSLHTPPPFPAFVALPPPLHHSQLAACPLPVLGPLHLLHPHYTLPVPQPLCNRPPVHPPWPRHCVQPSGPAQVLHPPEALHWPHHPPPARPAQCPHCPEDQYPPLNRCGKASRHCPRRGGPAGACVHGGRARQEWIPRGGRYSCGYYCRCCGCRQNHGGSKPVYTPTGHPKENLVVESHVALLPETSVGGPALIPHTKEQEPQEPPPYPLHTLSTQHSARAAVACGFGWSTKHPLATMVHRLVPRSIWHHSVPKWIRSHPWFFLAWRIARYPQRCGRCSCARHMQR